MPLLMDAALMRHQAPVGIIRRSIEANRKVLDFIDGKAATFPNVHNRWDPSATMESMAAEALAEPEIVRLEAEDLARTSEMLELGACSLEGRHAYYATEELTALILAGSARGVEALALSVADLPSPQGFAYLHRPNNKGLLLWWTMAQDDIVVTSLITAQKMIDWLQSEPIAPEYQWLPYASAALTPPGSDTSPNGLRVNNPFQNLRHDSEDEFDRADGQLALPVLFSFAHMLRQDVTDQVAEETEPAPVTDKRGRRRYRRDRITYLSARRGGASPGASDPNRHAREYSVRWVVRGHWRRQWYPSQNRHIPIWITDYIAGPDDAPLVHRDKVTMVTS
jgi:hypothetical protein